MKNLIYSVVLILWLPSVFAQSIENTFKQGNTLYNNEQYTEALNHYQKVLDEGMHSANLYFNIGNAHYKLNHIAESIYYFEKALLLDPNNDEVKNNLAFAQKMTIDAIENIPESGVSKIFNSLIGTVTYETWAKISVGAALLFVLCFIGYYFAYRVSRKRFLFITSGLMVIITLTSLFFAYQQEAHTKNTIFAIVFAEDSAIKAEPNLSSTVNFTLHEGTKIKVLEQLKDWKKIKLADGKTGWVLAADIKEL
jgi:tetratricopeptide (TPR) repeat protein